MKASIHPQYFEDLKIVCSCGNIIIAGSTKKTIKTEICSACHPFFTGQQKLIDTAGRVDKFMARMKKAEAIKAKKVKKTDEEVGEMMHEQEEAELKTSENEAEEVEKTEEKAAKPTAKKTTKKTSSTKKGK